MSHIAATGAGNWSSTTPGAPWAGGTVPGNGDEADLATFAVAMDIATIPASGTLLSLHTAGIGNLTVAMDAIPAAAINATTVQAGTVALIVVSGTAAGTEDHELTVTGNVIGGSTPSDYGIQHDSTCNIVVVGTGGTGIALLSGAVGSAYGMNVSGAGSFTIIGDVKGAAGTGLNVTGHITPSSITGDVVGGNAAGYYYGFGVANSHSTGNLTLTGNIINGALSVAWSGEPPNWTANDANYLDWYCGAALAAPNTKFGPEPLATELLSDVVCGDVTGTLVAGAGGGVVYVDGGMTGGIGE